VKEEYAYILDFLPNGYPDDRRSMHLRKSIAQAVGVDCYLLLELSVQEGVRVYSGDKVYVGKGDRKEVKHVERRIGYDKLTELAKAELPDIIAKNVKENEQDYVNFYNNLPVISHLLPGKHIYIIATIQDERKKNGPYKSFADIKTRVKGLGNPDKLLMKRIENEIIDNKLIKVLTA
jgi:putative nucleotide binding protein